jgi:acetate---CoA ligase (ADP-forming)
MKLDRLLSPRAIAVIGASHDERRPGGQALHALTTYGYAGSVHAVNPRYTDIRGLACYPDATALPEPVDLAVVAVPAAEVPRVVESCGAAGIGHVVILSAGFREMGTAGASLQRELEAALAGSGVRAVGPNCVGVLNLKERVFAGFGAGFRQPQWRGGPVALISQSGGFAYSIMACCQESGVGIDYMISTGNETDLSALDFVDHFMSDEAVRLVAIYLEGVADGRRLRALGRRALEAGKPIAVWKVGNTKVGQRAAASHTASLTGEYDFYRDAFREGGFVEIREVYDLVDAARVFRSGIRSAGRRVAIVTTSGGAGVLLADRCEEAGLELPPLADASVLEPLVPPFASLANPVDLTAALAQKEPEFSQATALVLADPHVDLAIVRSFPGRDVEPWAEKLAADAAASVKPVLVSLSGTPAQAAAWAPRLEAAGVPCFDVPSRAAAAAAMLCEFSARARRRSCAVALRRKVKTPEFAHAGSDPDEHEAKRWLHAAGIRTPRHLFIAEGAQCPARVNLAFPVAVKIVSPDIVHKTEAGGVRLNVAEEDLARTIEEIGAAARTCRPAARIRGVLIEEMAAGLEMIVGALGNASFGPIVMIGMGGVHAEVLRDVARRYAPVSRVEARAMIGELKGARLLEGYRGAAPRDVAALAEAISRLSELIAAHEAQIAEIEVNPLLVGALGEGVTAADAVIRLRR